VGYGRWSWILKVMSMRMITNMQSNQRSVIIGNLDVRDLRLGSGVV
jgi:hypothetical protein